jgi:hypothetical protein
VFPSEIAEGDTQGKKEKPRTPRAARDFQMEHTKHRTPFSWGALPAPGQINTTSEKAQPAPTAC